MEKIRVALGSRSYDILVNYSWLQDLGSVLRGYGLAADVMVFTSPKVGGLYFAKLRCGLEEAGFARIERYDIDDGEENKNRREWLEATDALAEFSPQPESLPLVLNLGGGVVGDLGGFAAGVFRRGVPYVQVPTTLLADVDCGVGGKVGVNHNGVKNLLGMYWQPRLVFADLSLLDTLDPREVRSGVAEVIKCGAVCDAALFRLLEDSIEDLVVLDKAVVSRVVRDCYRLKAEIVHQDERDDRGKRVVLNFGHTIGHAIEMAAEFRMTHGEAISVGMIAATRIAIELKVCTVSFLERLENLIRRAGLPTSADGVGPDIEVIMVAMKHDKKFVNGVNRFVLPVDCGDWTERQDVPESLVRTVVSSCVGVL